MNKIKEIFEGHYYYTDKSFKFSLDDDKERQFGLYIEIMDMLEATGESSYKDAPYSVSIQIVADKPSKTFNESSNRPTKLGLIYDCVSYMGGVPVDHILQDAINGGLAELKTEFTVDDAVLKTNKADFGSYAAQHGIGSEYQYLQFKTEDAAMRYVKLLLKRADSLSMLIGFILDKPLNLIGKTGWKTIEQQVKGK